MVKHRSSTPYIEVRFLLPLYIIKANSFYKASSNYNKLYTQILFLNKKTSSRYRWVSAAPVPTISPFLLIRKAPMSTIFNKQHQPFVRNRMFFKKSVNSLLPNRNKLLLQKKLNTRKLFFSKNYKRNKFMVGANYLYNSLPHNKHHFFFKKNDVLSVNPSQQQQANSSTYLKHKQLLSARYITEAKVLNLKNKNTKLFAPQQLFYVAKFLPRSFKYYSSNTNILWRHASYKKDTNVLFYNKGLVLAAPNPNLLVTTTAHAFLLKKQALIISKKLNNSHLAAAGAIVTVRRHQPFDKKSMRNRRFKSPSPLKYNFISNVYGKSLSFIRDFFKKKNSQHKYNLGTNPISGRATAFFNKNSSYWKPRHSNKYTQVFGNSCQRQMLKFSKQFKLVTPNLGSLILATGITNQTPLFNNAQLACNANLNRFFLGDTGVSRQSPRFKRVAALPSKLTHNYSMRWRRTWHGGDTVNTYYGKHFKKPHNRGDFLSKIDNISINPPEFPLYNGSSAFRTAKHDKPIVLPKTIKYLDSWAATNSSNYKTYQRYSNTTLVLTPLPISNLYNPWTVTFVDNSSVKTYSNLLKCGDSFIKKNHPLALNLIRRQNLPLFLQQRQLFKQSVTNKFSNKHFLKLLSREVIPTASNNIVSDLRPEITKTAPGIINNLATISLDCVKKKNTNGVNKYGLNWYLDIYRVLDLSFTTLRLLQLLIFKAAATTNFNNSVAPSTVIKPALSIYNNGKYPLILKKRIHGIILSSRALVQQHSNVNYYKFFSSKKKKTLN
jgi:hypothetical protein